MSFNINGFRNSYVSKLITLSIYLPKDEEITLLLDTIRNLSDSEIPIQLINRINELYYNTYNYVTYKRERHYEYLEKS